mgnify:CR=1 FL=1
MTIRYALNKSLNVPAVKAFNAAGADNVKTFAENLGFTFLTRSTKCRRIFI